jgi:hypothetical protein
MLVLPVGIVYWFFIRDDDASVNVSSKNNTTNMLFMQVTGG